jgi:D-beta-D-heptose 7-phosphate kinase/D-beta-D-heptose 1-phosphate adenosyltransferase
MGSVVTVDQYQKEIQSRRAMSPRRPPKVVFTNGCFDILHVGHTRYLRDARAEGDILVVGLNSDASVKRLKGDERPVNNEDDRAEILAALGFVDYVIKFTDDTPASLIEAVAPDVLVKGGDWPVEKIVGHKFVLARGGEVKSLPFHPGKSTTSILEKIKTL